MNYTIYNVVEGGDPNKIYKFCCKIIKKKETESKIRLSS